MPKMETAFISNVVYSSAAHVEDLLMFVNHVTAEMKKHFASYEIVIVNNCNPNMAAIKNALITGISANDCITIVHMSEVQSLEACMRAGVDVAVGDFVYEFESLSYDFNTDALWKAYQKAQEGYDIVNAEIKKNSLSRAIYYNVFNQFSKSQVNLYASAFRLVSRRAINRITSLNLDIDWRNAAYANCGLKTGTIEYNLKANVRKNRNVFLAIDSFLLYTDLPGKAVFCLASTGGVFTVLCIILACLKFSWTDAAFKILLTLCIALIMAVVLISFHYLSLLLRTSRLHKKYLVDGIEKLQRSKR